MNVTKITFWGLLSFVILFFCCFFVFFKVFPLKYKEIIVYQSQQNNLEPCLVAGIINVESGFNKNAVSSAGAVGLMQLMPQTANWIDKNLNLFNEEDNIVLGTKYLAFLFSKFQNKTLVLAAYNAGPTNVENWLNNKNYSLDGKTLFKIPFKETENYVKKVLQNEKIYQILLK